VNVYKVRLNDQDCTVVEVEAEDCFYGPDQFIFRNTQGMAVALFPVNNVLFVKRVDED